RLPSVGESSRFTAAMSIHFPVEAPSTLPNKVEANSIIHEYIKDEFVLITRNQVVSNTFTSYA
ncbi:hypothetical protein BB560_004381, partial [Smittium megazygosporum]